MGTASSGEWIAILLYFALVIGVGVYFFFRDRHQEGEKEYFLGGRSMGGWVAALSAGASDMSAWVLMGLPGSIYLYGICKVWISVGLLIGAGTPSARTTRSPSRSFSPTASCPRTRACRSSRPSCSSWSTAFTAPRAFRPAARCSTPSRA